MKAGGDGEEPATDNAKTSEVEKSWETIGFG